MKIFLISPVRNVSKTEREKIRLYVAHLEGLRFYPATARRYEILAKAVKEKI